MKVQIKATNISLSPSIEDYARKRVDSLEKYLSSLDPENAIAAVEIGKTSLHHKSGDVYRAEIRIRAKGREHYAVSEKDDLYAAIDEVRDEIVHEIVSSKEKNKTLLRRGGAKIKQLIKRLTW